MSGKAWRRKVAKKSEKPEFLEWLSHMDTELDTFFRDDVPTGFPHDDPYGPQALQIISDDLLERFPDWNSLYPNPEHAQYLDRLVRYFGQAWVEAFEGTWINLPAADEYTDPWEMGPAVRLPFFPLYHIPPEKIKRLLNLRREHIFSRCTTI